LIGKGSLHSDGYLVKRIGGRLAYSHRLAYEKVVGPIPEGMVIHHTCENKRCVNVEHMTLLTRAEHGQHHHQPIEVCPRCGGTERIQIRTRPGKSYCAPCERERDRRRR
jgi:hypothetical protein